MMKKIVTPVLLAGILATSSGCAKEIPSVGAEELSPQVSQNIQPVSQNVEEILTQTEKTSEFLDFDINNSSYERVWGEPNFSEVSPGTYRVVFPAGSYVPSAKDAPLGGAGFLAPLESLGETVIDTKTLEYKITFGENFDFVKGGKLPGFCGGSCPTGGKEKNEGFSTRFMWRKAGVLEMYAYLPTGVDTKYGESFVVPNFAFIPGKTYTLSQKIILNTVGQNNGSFEIFIDGVSVLKKENITFRLTGDMQIENVLFATFFGGNDPSFAAKKDENITFSDFKITE